MSAYSRIAKADERCFRYFAKFETWSREEAACLLAGYDPREGLRTAGEGSNRYLIEDITEYNNIFQLITRATRAFDPFDDPKPHLVIDWAIKKELWVSEILVAAVGRQPARATLLQRRDEAAIETDDSDELHPKAKSSMLRLIAGMAIKGYRFDPSAAKSEAVKEICRDLEELNIPVSDDTIRKWLHEACAQIDWDTLAPEMVAKFRSGKPK